MKYTVEVIRILRRAVQPLRTSNSSVREMLLKNLALVRESYSLIILSPEVNIRIGIVETVSNDFKYYPYLDAEPLFRYASWSAGPENAATTPLNLMDKRN